MANNGSEQLASPPGYLVEQPQMVYLQRSITDLRTQIFANACLLPNSMKRVSIAAVADTMLTGQGDPEIVVAKGPPTGDPQNPPLHYAVLIVRKTNEADHYLRLCAGQPRDSVEAALGSLLEVTELTVHNNIQKEVLYAPHLSW